MKMKMLYVASRFAAPWGHDEAALDETRRAGTAMSMITELVGDLPGGSEDRPCDQGWLAVPGGSSEVRAFGRGGRPSMIVTSNRWRVAGFAAVRRCGVAVQGWDVAVQGRRVGVG